MESNRDWIQWILSKGYYQIATVSHSYRGARATLASAYQSRWVGLDTVCAVKWQASLSEGALEPVDFHPLSVKVAMAFDGGTQR